MSYIKNISSYLSNLAFSLLYFTWDVEVSSQFLDDNLDRLIINTKAYHGHLGQDKLMKNKYGIVWGYIQVDL